MSEQRYESFEEFWPFYVREHSSKTNRTLHFIGSSLALGLLGYGIVARKAWPFIAAPVAGYGFAWVGHFLVEGNRPATFKYPAWSLMGDVKMWRMIASGKMDAEVERCLREHESKAETTNGTAHYAAE